MVAEMSPSTYVFAILALNAVCAAPPQQTKTSEPVVPETENNFSGVDGSHSRENATELHGEEHRTAEGTLTPGLAHGTEEGTPKDASSSSGPQTERLETTTEGEGQSNTTCDGQYFEEVPPVIQDLDSVKMEGNYTWTSPEGTTYIVTYKEDEDAGLVPTLTELGAGGPCGPLGPGEERRPGLSSNALLSLVGGK